MTRPRGQPILSASDVMRALFQLLPSAANNLGKVCLLNGEAGAVFDLPANMAKELLSMEIESGEVIEAITKLPNIVDEPLANGRFVARPSFQRGPPSGRPGGFYGGRPGGFSNRPADGGSWSNNGSFGSDSLSRSPGGDWSSGPLSGYGGSSRGNRPSFSYDTGSTGYGAANSTNRPSAALSSGYGSSSWGNRPSSSYDTGSSNSGGAYSSNKSSLTSFNTSGEWAGRPFSGQCLKCGQTGHRAVECPR
ncbi:hypothetical protein L7F22_047077 [Adiantum nelumboides]|nr:hypothetical protein [Adiantum nelumboides]